MEACASLYLVSLSQHKKSKVKMPDNIKTRLQDKTMHEVSFNDDGNVSPLNLPKKLFDQLHGNMFMWQLSNVKGTSSWEFLDHAQSEAAKVWSSFENKHGHDWHHEQDLDGRKIYFEYPTNGGQHDESQHFENYDSSAKTNALIQKYREQGCPEGKGQIHKHIKATVVKQADYGGRPETEDAPAVFAACRTLFMEKFRALSDVAATDQGAREGALRALNAWKQKCYHLSLQSGKGHREGHIDEPGPTPTFPEAGGDGCGDGLHNMLLQGADQGWFFTLYIPSLRQKATL